MTSSGKNSSTWRPIATTSKLKLYKKHVLPSLPTYPGLPPSLGRTHHLAGPVIIKSFFFFVLSKVLDTQSSPVHLFSCDPYSSSEKSQDWFYLFLAEQEDVTLSTHPEIHPEIPSTSGGYHFLPILCIKVFWMPVDTEVAEPHPRVSDSAGRESSMRICF